MLNCLFVVTIFTIIAVFADNVKDGIAVGTEKQVLNSAYLVASKFSLSQYAVENMDYVIEYNIYNVGDRPALKVELDDRNSFHTQSFEIVKGLLHVRWEKIPPGGNVTHSVVVRPRKYGTFNYSAARINYYSSENPKEVRVGHTTEPGEGYIYRQKDYDRRFSSKIGAWILFFLLTLPTTAIPFAMWYKLQSKYTAKSVTKKAQ